MRKDARAHVMCHAGCGRPAVVSIVTQAEQIGFRKDTIEFNHPRCWGCADKLGFQLVRQGAKRIEGRPIAQIR